MTATFFFRFYDYAGFSLSNDELSAINRLNFNSLSEVIQLGIRPDGHPAGAELLLYFWTHFFGMSPAAIRFPFVFISALAPLFGYLFLHKISGKAPALFLAAALSLLSFPQLYGQIARPYGIGLTFTLMAAFFWAKLLLDFPQMKRNIILYSSGLALAWSLCIYTHYFAALMAVIMGISGLFFLKKNNFMAYLSAAVATIILFLPHAEITIHQLSLGGVGNWLGKPDNLWLWNHILYIFNDSYLILFITLILIIGLFVLQPPKSRRIKLQIMLLFWFLLPFLIGFFYSIYVNPVLQNSVLIFSMPFLLAFLFSWICSRFTTTNKIALITFSLIIVTHTFFIKSYYKQQHFAEFERVPIFLNKWKDENSEKRILNLVQINHPYYLQYFIDQQNLKLNFHGRNYKSMEDMHDLKRIIDTTTADCISFSNIQNGANPITYSIIESKYPTILKSKSFGQKTDMWLFSKKLKEVKPINNDTIKSDLEFMGGKEIILKDVTKLDDEIMILRAIYKIKTDGFPTKAHIVYDIHNQEDKSVLWQSIPLEFILNNTQWQTAVLHTKIALKKDYYKIKIYIWNPGKENIEFKTIGIGSLLAIEQ